MNDFSRYVAGLPPEKLALLSQRMRHKKVGHEHAPLIQRRREGEPLSLSFAQQRLWFLDRLVPNNPFYNIPEAWRLTGALDQSALERSLKEIVSRHEALRTTFQMSDGQPVQVIGAAEVLLPVINLEELSPAEQEREVRRLAKAEAARPFDLSRGTLLRTTLLRLCANEHVLLLTMHHIISDNWSFGIFVRELAALYEASLIGCRSPLPDLPIQYADYARWQRQWMDGEVLQAQMCHWKQQLAGVSELKLPTDHKRPSIQAFRGAIHRYELSPDLSAALRKLSRAEGVTLFMTLLAAFNVLLYRYTGQEDIVVGSPIANRNRTEIEALIGFFVNMLVMRTKFSGTMSFRELLSHVRRFTLGAYAHQDLPFEKLVEELQPGRDLSRTPIFQVVFSLSNAPMPPLELSSLTLRRLDVETGAAMFDLILGISDTEPSLTGMMLYNTQLFEAETITSMWKHFQIILEQVTIQPDQCLIDIPLVKFEGSNAREDAAHVARHEAQEVFHF